MPFMMLEFSKCGFLKKSSNKRQLTKNIIEKNDWQNVCRTGHDSVASCSENVLVGDRRCYCIPYNKRQQQPGL